MARRGVVERARGDERRLARAGRDAALLVAYGIPLVPERVAATVDEAVAAPRALGFPVVVKTAARRRAQDRDGRRRARPARRRRGSRRGRADRAPVLVQTMVAGGAELLAGVVQDPVFGPLVAFGPGGVLAELIGEA